MLAGVDFFEDVWSRRLTYSLPFDGVAGRTAASAIAAAIIPWLVGAPETVENEDHL